MNNSSSLGLFSQFAAALISFFQTFSKTMGVVSNVVDMGASAVEDAREAQAVDLELAKVYRTNQKINSATLAHAKQEEAVAEYASGSEARTKLVNETKAMLTERVNRRLAELKSK